MLKKIMSAVAVCALTVCALGTFAVNAAEKNVKIMLDPGHGLGPSADGSTTIGTNYAEKWGGKNELYYNLSISEYTKERLEQYENVSVGMTRTTNEECPGLKERVSMAKRFRADAFISIHNNMFSDENVHGTVVLIPNQNYKPQIGKDSLECANKITSRLVNDARVHKFGDPRTYDTPVNTYPDGSAGDQYTVIRAAKESDIPVGMIVECAFLSSKVDYEKHFTSERGLKALGYAIADGLADYYDLTLKSSAATDAETDKPNDTTVEVTDKTTDTVSDTVAEANTNGSLPGWLIPVIIAAVVVICAICGFVVYLKKK